jgi:hypothetical protein
VRFKIIKNVLIGLVFSSACYMGANQRQIKSCKTKSGPGFGAKHAVKDSKDGEVRS